MARSFSDVLKGVTRSHRTGQPVRRNSYNRGERENRVWRPINKREVGARLRAAEQFDRKHKQPGKRNGPLGHVGLEVLRQLYRVVDHRNGRCEPSIDYVARAIGRARASVVAALKRLKAHGFVNWLRRTEPTESDGAGPQVKQIPNAYWFGLPKFAAELVERLTSRGPIPADEQWRLDEARAAHKAMLATLPLAELPHATVMDPGLAAALSSLGAGVARIVSSASSASGQNPAEEV